MEDIKPCPFCGSEVKITKGVYNAPFWFFKCTNRRCGAVISFDNDRANICPDVAIYNYNERWAENDKSRKN